MRLDAPRRASMCLDRLCPVVSGCVRLCPIMYHGGLWGCPLVYAAIIKVLSELDIADDDDGSAFMGRPDPKRTKTDGANGRPPNDSPWRPSVGRCPNCKVLDKEGKKLPGKHWKRDCTKQAEADAVRAARAAAAAPEEIGSRGSEIWYRGINSRERRTRGF